MRRQLQWVFVFGVLLVVGIASAAEEPDRVARPYRLGSVDLKQRVIWGSELRFRDGSGLAFGGQDQDADDGRPHTRVLVDGQWQRIDAELRKSNPNQKLHQQTWQLRNKVKALMAKARFHYFKGTAPPRAAVAGEGEALRKELRNLASDFEPAAASGEYAAAQRARALSFVNLAQKTLPLLESEVTPQQLREFHSAQIQLELASEALDAEPAPRAIDCGVASKADSGAPRGSLAYDAKTKLYLLFGGDHLDYLTNDLWIFDPASKRWSQRHPKRAPAPRANHRMHSAGDGTIRISGGYTYTSNTDYVGGQYLDLNDGDWIYDIANDRWEAADDGAEKKWHPPHARTYRRGPFHPAHYYLDAKPDAAKFEAWLKSLPANQWFTTNPPVRPRLNRDWGVARIDPDRDLMLRWSGGHSAHGGSDVPHFHFSTNRWELTFPVEFPLGQLYSNTSYPRGYNFNLRPWVTGHTYQNYAYDPPSKRMVVAGRPRNSYVYDPDLADWVSRSPKPEGMRYNSCFYTLTLTATPQGAVCWDKNGTLHRYTAGSSEWKPIEVSGDPLPGAYVDNSSICYDSRRDRVLIFNSPGYNKPYTGQVWSVEMKTGKAKALSPTGMDGASRMANIDKSCYDPENDLVLFGTFPREKGKDKATDKHTPTPAYDAAANRWVTLDLKYEVTRRGDRVRRAFPHTRSDALMFDPKRKLIWGVDTNGQVYVLRLEKGSAGVKLLR